MVEPWFCFMYLWLFFSYSFIANRVMLNTHSIVYKNFHLTLCTPTIFTYSIPQNKFYQPVIESEKLLSHGLLIESMVDFWLNHDVNMTLYIYIYIYIEKMEVALFLNFLILLFLGA